MARVVLTADAAVGPYSAVGKTITFTQADVGNKELTALTGREFIIAMNTGAGTHIVTITSMADEENRTGDQAHTIPAMVGSVPGIAILGPFPISGWQQTDGNLYFEANHAEIYFAVIRLPASLN